MSAAAVEEMAVEEVAVAAGGMVAVEEAPLVELGRAQLSMG